MAPTRSFRYAGFWQRVAAAVIDSLVLLPLLIVPFALMWDDLIREVDRSIETGTEVDPSNFVGKVFFWTLVVSVLVAVYHVLMIGRWNATVGKFALGIRVRKTDGTEAGWREAALRPLLQLGISLLNLVPGVGLLSILDYLWMLWDDRKQTLHDKIAGTIVVAK